MKFLVGNIIKALLLINIILMNEGNVVVHKLRRRFVKFRN